MSLTLPADMPPFGPFCGVLAVAMVASVPFAQAWDVMKARQPSPSRWRGRTKLNERLRVLDVLGVTVEEFKLPRRMTLKTFVQNHTKRDVTYKVTVTGHVVTVRNNAVADQLGVLNILLHKSCRQRVRHVLIIKEN